MTRLQKLLSQIKTVDELAKVLGVSPYHLFKNTGVAKYREQLIHCHFENCENCALYQGGHCTSRYGSMIQYFNTELPDNLVYADTDGTKITSDHAPVIKLRDSARKLMKTVVIEGFNQGHSAQTVYRHLDEYIDVLEGIGLFEENELRTYVATDLLEVLIERRKKTK